MSLQFTSLRTWLLVNLPTILPSLLDIFYRPIFDFFQENRLFQQALLWLKEKCRNVLCSLDCGKPCSFVTGKETTRLAHCGFAYSAFAAMSMGMSASASFQSVRKS